jgi:hypothetical protein
LYSAGFEAAETAVPHSLQNFALDCSSAPHDLHAKPAAVMRAPPISGPRLSQLPKDRATPQQETALFDTGIKAIAVFVIGTGQPDSSFVWLPIFDQLVVERGCHLANQVSRPHGRDHDYH